MKEWVLKGFVVALGLVLVFVSITRASLDILAKEIDEDAIKNRYLEFTIRYGDGETEPANYNLPEVGMLPNNPFYGFKKIRDWMWLNLSSGVNKSKLAILMADKKMTEAGQLFLANQNRTAIEAGIEAMDKLEYANSLLAANPQPDDNTRFLRKQVLQAGYAYMEIARLGAKNFDLDQVKYNGLLERIESWNQKQEAERWNWQE